MEYRIHTHASYATCETEDHLRIAGSYTPKLAADKDAQAALVPDFFQLPANNSDGDPLWAGCQSRPMQVRRPCIIIISLQVERWMNHGTALLEPLRPRRTGTAVATYTTAPSSALQHLFCMKHVPMCTAVSAAFCRETNPPTRLQIHYMYGALFRQQTQHLRQWIEADEASGPKPVKLDFIVSVMFWTPTPYVSQASPHPLGLLTCSISASVL